MAATPGNRRPIRSYVMRAGRLTDAQQRALDQLYPLYGIAKGDGPLDFTSLFGREAERVMEIGFGNGEATWRMARNEQDRDFVAVEVHPPGVGRLLQAIEDQGLENVRVFMGDAVSLLEHRVRTQSLAAARIYFPDPWPKKRHYKRRLVQPAFVRLVADRLKPAGLLHLATDWQPYADHMLEVLSGSEAFENVSTSGDYCERPDWRPATKYERRGERLGHETRDLIFRRVL